MKTLAEKLAAVSTQEKLSEVQKSAVFKLDFVFKDFLAEIEVLVSDNPYAMAAFVKILEAKLLYVQSITHEGVKVSVTNEYVKTPSKAKPGAEKNQVN